METLSRVTVAPRRFVDLAIRGYQRYLSPRKGYTCAHLVARGGQSCSAVIRGIIAERGVLRGVVPTLAQFAACHQAALLLSTQPSRVQGVCCCGGIPIPFRF
ncbi:membrane protein insertion efficiency factor YidD [Kocuria sp. JC486]|uniref:Membrane protein insertion efficiency factor YidD n=1 Tax=Kocuria soli TaxID=2485125 RepID=A0A3N3ZS43_9MICC|nr:MULTISPECIES: membrane protein insertion efficiency factor YidD [Kocuria]NHU84937.1 membrane protein insertion efficiency factor YidD [Kocuria sp. JC486]ROZ63339.1 membrane protein insertion efficiency factor YidD [Kocuria soli]